ncbi:hypothetical protein [Georgenia sp. SUBG003]|uniref:hypothetical protein n=1 Tax=Georgenia sp. SUBG003 TaxID=1497974 RepID=UPI000693D9C8
MMTSLAPATGDDALDELLAEAMEKFSSHHANDRKIGIERLWDGFERLKTLDNRTNKKASVAALLDNITDPAWRAVVEAEMVALTDLGNQFNIRHFETRVATLPPGTDDYLFGRMGNMLLHLLLVSGRLEGPQDPSSIEHPYSR